jgi:hypothetical protein
MKNRLIIGVTVAIIAGAASFVVLAGQKNSEPAHAPERLAALPDYEIIASVRALGYYPTTPAFRRGAYYVLHAEDAYGSKLRVVADAQLGDIVSVRQVFLPRYDAGPRIIHVPQPGEGASPPSGRK